MRVVTNKNTEFMKGISYAVLAAGNTSGVWSDDVSGKKESDISRLSTKKTVEVSASYL